MRYVERTVANSISEQQLERPESGFQRTSELDTAASGPEALIRAHNQELSNRTRDLLALPLLVVTEQRDKALRLWASAQEKSQGERRQLIAEQDRFITFLMTDHESKLAEIRQQLEAAKGELERHKAFLGLGPDSGSAPVSGMAGNTRQQIDALKQALGAASAEIEETRADATRLQEERDDAIRAIDDTRVELLGEVEAARDEAFRLETQLDEANRLLEDTRDQARDEACRFNEELSDARRELDERNEEVRRLRARLASHVSSSSNAAEIKASHPPPPPSALELEKARREAQQLRQQLLETKREVLRLSRELELARNPRGGGPRSPALTAPLSAPKTRRFDPKLPPDRRVPPVSFQIRAHKPR